MLKGELSGEDPGELSFGIVEPDSPEMEELLRGIGEDRLLEVYLEHPPLAFT